MNYVAASMQTEHPRIQWPRHRPPKKPGDAPGDGPDPRCIENTAALLDAYGIRCRWNLMRHALEIDFPNSTLAAERAQNASLSRVIELAVRCGLGKENLLDHLTVLTREYHPVADWIGSRPWDGTDRIGALMDTIGLAPGSDATLTYILIKKWLLSCCRAVLPPVPGARKFTPQGVLTFQGPQGIGKTEWLKHLAPPDTDWISTGRVIDPHTRDSVQQATSFWIVELGELDATYRKADIAALKAFVTQDTDTYRAAYARREENTPRRTVLAASVNPRYFLVDDTGNRRWWTVSCASLRWDHGIDMQQMWAQVMVEAKRADAQWWLTPDENRALSDTNAGHEVGDPLAEDLWAAWEPVPVQSVSARITLSDIWSALPGRGNKGRTKAESTALANALRAAGVENETLTHGVKTYRVKRILPDANTYRKADSWHDHV